MIYEPKRVNLREFFVGVLVFLAIVYLGLTAYVAISVSILLGDLSHTSRLDQQTVRTTSGQITALINEERASSLTNRRLICTIAQAAHLQTPAVEQFCLQLKS